MALNRPGPFTLQFPTFFSELSHVIEVNCDVIGAYPPGIIPADVQLRSRGGDGIALDVAANALWAVLRTQFHTTTLCSNYALYKRSEVNDERLFVSGGSLTALNGVSTSLNILASQLVLTWRSAAGGIAKISLLEGVFVGQSRLPIAADGGFGIAGLNAYILSSSNVVMARDRSFPVASMNSSYGNNNKVAERRFRS